VTRAGFLAVDRIAHRAALVGRVIDGLSSEPLSRAQIEIIAAPVAYQTRLAWLREARPDAAPDRLLVDANGAFRWLDLPPGVYTLRASVSGTRYAATTTTVTVGAAAVASAELRLPPTAITGVIKADQPAGALAMACVRLSGSGETTYTAADGTFTLSAIEPGTTRMISATAKRYAGVTRTVAILQGQTTTIPTITLTHS
jgi:hypothetical protein